MNNNTKVKTIIISIFLMLTLLVFILLNFEKNSKIEQHLQNKTDQYTRNYTAVYKSYKQLSHLIFETEINNKEVKEIFKDASSSTGIKKDLIRTKLYNTLSKTYLLLKKYNIKQLHFHLPNNESFLRYHRPAKYGDNLTDIRGTVKFVNEYQKQINGFEEGRIYNGYRFVFPLFYNNDTQGKDKEYIGSVEVSFSTMIMSLDLMNSYKVISSFLILKDRVDKKLFSSEKKNYIQSPFENFYIEKKFLEEMAKLGKIQYAMQVSQNTQNIINKKGLDKNSFSLYDSAREQVLTFIKVENPVSKKVVGILAVRSDANYIFYQNNYFYFLFLFFILFVAIALFGVYKELEQKTKLKMQAEQEHEINIQLQKAKEEVEQNQHKVLQINKTLEERVHKEVEHNRRKDQAMIQKSRLTQMGEMLSVIAHQWRQPLNSISATGATINLKAKLNQLDNTVAIELSQKISDFAQQLSITIDDFRDFFMPAQDKSDTNYNELVKSVLNIVETSIKNKNIQVIIELNCNDRLYVYPNEIQQVILNLISNAEDILLENKIVNPYIKIVTFKEENHLILELSDNGGGVRDDIIEKIFDPYFSTKLEKNGTGLGLYMSKIIIEEHCDGTLSVHNNDYGAVFKITLSSKGDKKI